MKKNLELFSPISHPRTIIFTTRNLTTILMQISTQTEPQTLLPQLTNIKILLNIFIWVPSVSPKLRWPKLVTVRVPDPFCLWCLLLYYPGLTHPSTLTPVFPIFYGSSLCWCLGSILSVFSIPTAAL